MSVTRQRLSSEDRQEEIIKAAIDLAGDRGPEEVTTHDMARAIGVTQGAIFRHFPSKDMIWTGVIHWVRGRLMTVVDVAASQGTDPIDSLERVFFAHLGFVEKHPALPRLILSGQLLRNPKVRFLLQETLRAYEDKLMNLLARAKAEHMVSPGLDEVGAASMLLSLIQGLVTRIYVLEQKKTLAEEGRVALTIYLAGIGHTCPTAKEPG